MDLYRLLQAGYWLVVAALCFIAWTRGGRPEREGAAVVAIGSACATAAAASATSDYGSAQLGIFAVDIAALVAFLSILIRHDRYWPIWASGFHLVGVATHLAKLSFPDILPQAYWAVQGMWAYPIMIAIVAGTMRPMTLRTNAPA